jgi:hypothetical protein
MSYTLCPMRHALCPMLYALCSLPSALFISYVAIQYCFLRFFSLLNGLSFNSMQLSPLALRFQVFIALPYALYSLLSSEFRIPSTEFGNAPCSLRSALYSMLHALCAMLSSLCSMLYALCPLSLDISEI